MRSDEWLTLVGVVLSVLLLAIAGYAIGVGTTRTDVQDGKPILIDDKVYVCEEVELE